MRELNRGGGEDSDSFACTTAGAGLRTPPIEEPVELMQAHTCYLRPNRSIHDAAFAGGLTGSSVRLNALP